MTLMIETKNLTKNFGNLTAVDEINIKVEEGTIHGFIGPNGAGKTTTMKMLIGVLNPNKGTALIKGHQIGSIQAKKLIGYSPEHPKFYDDMFALDYLVYIGRLCGMDEKSVEEEAKKLLKYFELEQFSYSKIKGFSAGMKQKLSLAQAMIHGPELLILDEPTANLDPSGRLSIIKTLKTLCSERKMTVFISSHILAELEKLVDFVTIINHGQIVAESEVKKLEKKFAGNEYILKTNKNRIILSALKAKDLVAQARTDEAGAMHIIAKDADKFQRTVPEIIAKAGASLEEFRLESSDLEKVFMELVEKENNKEKEEKK
jgi:ABC-2 type transport system ATP-binding protein